MCVFASLLLTSIVSRFGDRQGVASAIPSEPVRVSMVEMFRQIGSAKTTYHSYDRYSDLAFVTGYIGRDGGQCRIPTMPRAGHSYFITNLSEVARAALNKGWIPIMIMCENTATYIDITAASKPLKVFPQQFVSRVSKREYRFMVWFDNKFDVNVAGVSDAVAQWKPNHALLMHRHPFLCCGADLELKESMKQPRYKLQEKQYVKYMEEEARAGFPTHGERHFQTGFLLYRLDHPDCAKIQNMWMAHIKRCGIQCQISMYYVAQRFPDSIGEYKASISQDS